MDFRSHVLDPLKFGKWLWPQYTFYKEQEDIVYSVRDNRETVVVAGNMLGKDFVTAFIVLWFFLTRHPVRIVTTSANYSQLQAVLWGEIRNFIATARYALDSERGGIIVNNHLHLKKIVKGQECGLSYCIGLVSAKGEGLLGHHVAETGDGIPRTLFVGDEASGIDNRAPDRAKTWARRELYIGNPYPPTPGNGQFFYDAVMGGDITDDSFVPPPPAR